MLQKTTSSLEGRVVNIFLFLHFSSSKNYETSPLGNNDCDWFYVKSKTKNYQGGYRTAGRKWFKADKCPVGSYNAWVARDDDDDNHDGYTGFLVTDNSFDISSVCCQDRSNWRFELSNGRKRGCGWVANNPLARCHLVGTDGTRASESCQTACDS